MENNDFAPSRNENESSGESSPTDRTQTWQLIFEKLAAAPNREIYRQQLQQAAETMNCSLRTVQRHLQRWKEENSTVSQVRQSRGQSQVSDEMKHHIIQLYLKGTSRGNKINPMQVFRRLKFELFTSETPFGQEECPSLSTVYRVLHPIIESQQTQRRLGEARHSQIVLPKSSNEVWWANLIRLPRQVRDCFGEPLAGHPILVTFHDARSENVMGIKLALLGSPKEVLMLALRQAILPKRFEEGHAPINAWTACGLPKQLVVDWAKSISELSGLCSTLGIECHWRRPFWAMSATVESFNRQMMHTLALLPECRDQQVPCLSLADLEQLIIHYIVDHYNQHNSPKDLQHTRTESWEAGLVKFPPNVPLERSLNICLPKTGNRVVQNSGCVQFEGWIYRDAGLSSHIGESVHLRYNPSNITTILVYQQQGSEENFLARACIQHFHEESLSLDDARAIRHRQRQKRNPN
ncbi:MAG: Mu transposase C-terminal domain-containing protein [Leptolyngbya sp. Prado105]|jgi:putative transposase|nr:Mu transposase C-terminal domain-containing protein [Leptolyngbya sp. Prado105]